MVDSFMGGAVYTCGKSPMQRQTHAGVCVF